jgi:Protein of unknown function (DUF4232)
MKVEGSTIEGTRPATVAGESSLAAQALLIKEAKRHHRQRLFVIGVGIVIVLVAATTAVIKVHGGSKPPAVSNPRTATGRLPRCTVGQLTTSLGASEPGMMQIGFSIVFRNSSRSPCRFAGYPRLVGLDATGLPAGIPVIDVPASESGVIGKGVHLGPGLSASAFVDTGASALAVGEKCAALKTLLVTPPGDTGTSRLALKGTPTQGVIVDGIQSCGSLRVDSVQAVQQAPAPVDSPAPPPKLPTRDTGPGPTTSDPSFAANR